MSTAGPYLIHECSSCGAPIAEETLASGNDLGAKYWTDGYRDAPMNPDRDWLVVCPHCKSAVWIDDQSLVTVLRRPGPDQDVYPQARLGLRPQHQDYMQYIESASNLCPDRESYLRLRAWWSGNDSRRSSKRAYPLSIAEKSNLRALIDLLDTDEPSDRIFVAEAFRELGEHDEALCVLSMSFPSGLKSVVTVIKNLALSKVSDVSELRL